MTFQAGFLGTAVWTLASCTMHLLPTLQECDPYSDTFVLLFVSMSIADAGSFSGARIDVNFLACDETLILSA